ncbi:MAG: T9SS type B sorting domain-containing protein [Flavobacteriaceae bacterium]|nr:T9SS type B sorting domain-containing protein [Flavobacteriaceae bacterium]
MNKPTIKRCPSLIIVLLFFGIQTFAQNFIPFTPRFDQDLKGDIVLIGNNILGPDNNPYNNNSTYNHNVDMQYIDIDGDPSTFSSSSADLEIPNPNCYVIRHASLYWGAVTKGDQPFTSVKFKGPTGGYNDITGTVIFDANGTSVDGGDSFPYACYADVTDIVTGLTNNLGTYTLANVSSALGETSTFNPYNGTGYSAGWSLFVVYEDPTLPGKSITSFDGFSAISFAQNPNLDIPVSGFRTVPTPAPVRANFAFATLEGDKPITGDRLKLNGTTLSTVDRSANNYFNSSVTQLSALPVDNRNPNSTNTLGFDTGVMSVPNPGNTVIANDATSATVRLETSGDTYFQYLIAFAVEIIEPKIVLTKIVEDEFGNNIGGQTVALGQDLNYVIGFQNTGNDNATNFTIRDILPINIIFNYPADLVLPPGVTVTSYDPATRELIFAIEDYLVEENDPVYEIRIEVQVVDTCQQLAAACSDIINNQAFATYYGTLNPTFVITDDPSINTNTGCLITPQATNFLANLDDCVFSQNEILCGSSMELTAADGYDSYSWSTSPTGTPVIGTTQTITVTQTGTYYSFNTALAPCRSIVQEYDVTLYGSNITNPVIPFADEVVTCPNDGKLLPNIYLCGENDFTEITTNVASAITIIWEKLDESSCPPVGNTDCANEDNTCTWDQVGIGADYTADTSGQFRLTINYEGGCFNQFYFNVYQNLLEPTVTATDIICDTPGSITVGNVPSGYEYSLDGVNYQSSNFFQITIPGLYTVYIQQVGVPENACVFTIPDVLIRERDFTVSTNINQPLCNGDLGSIYLAANDAEPQYFFSLYSGGVLVNSVGPIVENNYAFENLNPGVYTVTVETEDGCTYTETITIINPPLLTVTAAITIPLTCIDGEITVYPVGGTPPYFYFVNNNPVFQTVPEIVVTAPGVFNILVVDSNNCSAETTITVEAALEPEFIVETTDILCAGDLTGSININVTNPNGNTLQYSINGGLSFTNSPLFTGLTAGNYNVVVEYTFGPSVCLTDIQIATINEATPITGIAELTAPYTCTSNGTITATNVTGGNPPYTYSIDGITFQSDPNFTNLTAGTYSITIMDANGCTIITNEITIPPLDPPTDLMFSNSPLTCPTNLVSVTITGTTGGVPPLEYQITAPVAAATPYQTSTVFTNLAPDTYTFQVKDANDCTYSETYVIEPLETIDIFAETINNVSCFGTTDGTVQFTVSGTTSFEYSINGNAPIIGTSPIVLTGLGAGSYTIVVTDLITNCEATATAIVDEPANPLIISVVTSPITCIADGSVIINASGGWGGYIYTLTLPDLTVLPPQGSNTFINLTQAGSYLISVEDANGCVVTDTFNLTIPNPPVASISTASDLCYDTGNNATIIVDVSSGEAPFEFSINGGPFVSNNVFSNLGPSSYIITVRDAFGCETTMPAEIIAPELLVSAVLTEGLDCTATPDAIITGNISGGTAPYTYAVSINGSAFNPLGTTATPFTYTTGTAGTYQFEITDANGCTATSPIITVNPITLPAIDLITQTQPILCNGDENGAINITIDPTTGTPPFQINVTNDTTGTDYGTQTTGLPAGVYTITITDANFCVGTDTITITQPDPMVVDYDTVDITCGPGGVSQGSIIINSVVGGTAPYNYFVSSSNGYSNSELNATGSTSVSFDIVDFGLYEINIVDSNGCSVLFQDVLIASPPDDLDIVINSTVDCTLGGEAVVTVSSLLGSTGPFHFAIYQGPGTVYPNPTGAWIPENPLGSQSTIFTGLIPGVTYTFIVYDESTMCSYYEPATLPIPTNSTLTATAVSSDNVTCTGNDDGDVSFTVNSSYASSVNVNYEIFDSLSLITTGISGTGVVPAGGPLVVSDLGPLPFGTYFVLIEETTGPNAGCGVVTAPFSITESAFLLSLSTSVDQNANCNLNSGVISAIAQNGTAPYLYQITTTLGAPLPTDPAWNTANIFNVNAGNYYVHTMDAYECIITSPEQVVGMDPSPVITATTTNQCSTVEGQFEIDVTLITAGTPPYSFSINGGSFQTQSIPFTISNLTSGTHTIEVNDANGCGNLVTVVIEPPLGLTPTVTALPSCDDDDGEITVTANGGTGNYAYTIAPNPPSIVLTGNVFSGVPSGTYIITVTDTVTTCTEDVSVTLDSAIPVTFNTEVTDVSCQGGNDGQIIVELLPGNDNPIYTYEITAPIVVLPQTSNIFIGLSAATYTVLVTSGRGCIATANVTINEPPLLEVTGSATSFACNPDNTVATSIITITEVGGTPDYTFSINGTDYFNTNVFEVLDTGAIQIITVYVKDANNCTATNTVTIDPLPTITAASVAIVTPIDCNQIGTVSINVTGGSGNFEYQLLPDGIPQASNVFDIPGPGTYYYQVIDLDTDCYFLTAPFIVLPFDEIDALLNTTEVNDCFGDMNGEIALTISGYIGAYTYQLFDGTGVPIGGPVNANTSTNPQLITGLASGNYSVEIVETETPFCTTTSNVVTIGSPPTPLTLDVTETANVTCNNNIGVITAMANGGTSPYEYELTGAATVPYSSNNMFINLSAGTYTVNARDTNGCIESETITLVEPDPIDADFVTNTTMLSCFNDQNAILTVENITGGQGGNYSFTLITISPIPSISGPQTSNIFENLGAGVYSVTITDGYDCQFTSLPVTINQPEPIISSLVANTTPTCLIEAELTLSAVGGTGVYEYSDTVDFTTVLGTFTTSITFPVSEGTYNYFVRDVNGCIDNASNEITIDPLPDLEVVLVSSNPEINCAGDNTGVIEATAIGGLGNYIYTLQDTSGNTIPADQNSPGIFTGLIAGTYVVFVESGDCLVTSDEITITEPDTSLEATFEVTDVLCNGENDGRLEIFASGGSGIIKYAISPNLNQFFETNIFENLSPGTYNVIVQDQLGCFLTFNFEISEPLAVLLTIVADSIIPEVCEGDQNGFFSIDIEGGTLPYSVSLDDYNGPYTTGEIDQTIFEFDNLNGGDHVVYIRDVYGCESEWNITFPEAVFIEPLVEVEILCIDNVATNIVTVTVDENLVDITQLEYSLNDGPYQSSNVFTDISPSIDNYITVKHTNGCSALTEFFDIETFTPVGLTLEDGELNEIVAIAVGGTEEYVYTMNGVDYGSENIFTITESGTFEVTVTDNNGCMAVAIITKEFIDICILNYFTPNGDGVNDGWTIGCAPNYPNLRFSIYDRYGRKVANLRAGEKWYGTYNGNDLPAGDYWYVVETDTQDNIRDFVGHFTLYR